MTLSRDVAKKIQKPASRSSGPSPFGGMNRTDPGLLVAAERKRGEANRAIKAKKAEKKGSKFGPKNNRSKGQKDRREGDMKALKMQQSLSNVPYGHRTEVKTRIEEVQTFEDFPLLPAVQAAIGAQALKGLENIGPTPIQKLAVPALLGVRDRKGRQARNPVKTSEELEQFLVAAETGSGKTLAYLLPIVDSLKRAEREQNEREAQEKALEEENKKMNLFEVEPPPLSNAELSDAGRPRAIILLPTAELVDQVGKLFKAFSHTVKLRVALVSASYTAVVIRNRLFSPQGIDVVISTPHLLNSIAQTQPYILSRVTHLVADEADSLFDRSFAPLTSAIIDRASPSLQQLILCSATIPRSLDSYLRARFPDIQRLTTPRLHAIPRRVQLSVVDIDKDPYRGNRDLACADTIWSIGRSSGAVADSDSLGGDSGKTYNAGAVAEAQADAVKRILVFVNEREKAQELASYLHTKGVDAAALNRDTESNRTEEILAGFTSSAPQDARFGQPTDEHRAARILPNTRVLVTTDIASRGIDTIAVRNVLLYDVPHTTVDFIHRLGRTGRMGRRGRGVVLVGKGDRKDVVREVREGMFMGRALI
ncbi:MAG: RNA helicase [Alyxoria varia]|nr:MAG: RNA helicase [Alyxoria varia]